MIAYFCEKRDEMNDKNPKQRGLLRLFLSYFKPHRKLFLLDISCAVMIFRSFDAVSLSVSISLAGVILSDCAGSVRLWDMISK